jgi:uncharacterized protein (DUF952 family)
VRILHLAAKEIWEQARVDGTYRGSTRGADLGQVGYVHASSFQQLPRVADALYAGELLDDQVLLVIDVDGCELAGSRVRWEVPAGADEAFPHVYGPIPVSAVFAALPVCRTPDGTIALPDLSGLEIVGHPDERF